MSESLELNKNTIQKIKKAKKRIKASKGITEKKAKKRLLKILMSF
jgi:hypothetical protein